MANELYKNILQRLPAALSLVFCIFGVLYLQNIFLILIIRLITKVISDACARGLASSQGGALNIQTDDEAPAVKVKKAAVTSGKALNLVHANGSAKSKRFFW